MACNAYESKNLGAKRRGPAVVGHPGLRVPPAMHLRGRDRDRVRDPGLRVCLHPTRCLYGSLQQKDSWIP